MAENIKISELEPTTDLEGLHTIGTDKNNLSKKVSLQFIKEAADYANAQGDYAKSVGDTVAGNVGTTDFPVFSASAIYKKGDVVRYKERLYKFTAPHQAGAWNGSDVQLTSVNSELREELTELESEVNGVLLGAGDNNYKLIEGKAYRFENTGTGNFNIGYVNGVGTYVKIGGLDIGQSINYTAVEDANTINVSLVTGAKCVVYELSTIGGQVRNHNEQTSLKFNSIDSEINAINRELDDIESEVSETLLSEGNNNFRIQKDKSYIIRNEGPDSVNIGYYTSKEDADNDINYQLIKTVSAGETYIYKAEADAPVIRKQYSVNAICYISAMDTLYGKVTLVQDEVSGQTTIVNAIEKDREIVLTTDIITNQWIDLDGTIKNSSNYLAYQYRIDEKYEGSQIKAEVGMVNLADGVIAFYNSTNPSANTCIKVVMANVLGIKTYVETIPQGARLVVVSTRKTVYPYENVKLFFTNAITSLCDDIYTMHPKYNVLESTYIEDGSGKLMTSANYKSFEYVVNRSTWNGNLSVKLGHNSTSDAAIAFYDDNDDCIKTITAVIGVNQYYAIVPSNTKKIVVSTRISVHSDVDAAIQFSKPIFENQNDLTIKSLRVATFNVGDYTGKDLANGSAESRKAFRSILAHQHPMLVGIQADVNNFGANNPRSEIWGMFKNYHIKGDSAYNYKGFATDTELCDVKQVFFKDDTFSHPYFLVGLLPISKSENMLVMSIHLDWQDNDKRAKQYQQIIDYASTYDYVVIMGDTNCENYENGVKIDDTVLIEEWDRFTENGYTMANNGYFGIYDTYNGGGGEPLDNIFVKGNIVINNFEVIQKEWMNDHYLVVADLSVY
jgi:hypothetical protein